MKRFFKILLTLLISIVLLTILGVVVLILLIDPNDYKPHITQYVEQHTGRTLTITGDIHLTFFPWLGLNLGEVQLGNAKGFTEPTFASAQQAKIRVRLFPLFLQKRIESDTASLEGVTLTLTRQKSGVGNWEDLKALLNKSEESSTIALNIEQLSIKDATFIWDDRKLDLFYHVTDIQLQTQAVNLENPFPMTANFHLVSQKTPAFSGDFTATAQARIDLAQQKYTLADLKVNGQIQSPEIPIAKQDIIIASQMTLDLHQETLAFEPLNLQTLDENITVTSDMHIRDLFGEQLISGKLRTPPLNLQKVLNTLDLPALPSGELLKTATIESLYEIKGKSVAFEKLQLKIDENVLNVSKLALEIADKFLEAETFSLQAWGVNAEGRFFINALFDQPIAKGHISLRTDDLSKVLKQFGQTMPHAFPVKQASLDTQFQGSAHAVTLTDWHSQIDEHSLAINRMQLDILKNNLTVSDFLLTAFDAKANGQFVLKNVFSKPQGQGYIKLTTLNPRQLAQYFGQNLPELTEKTALTRVNVETYWEGDETRFQAKNLKLQIDDSYIQGQLSVEDFSQPKVLFNISVDTIDLDPYLPPANQKNSEPFTLPVALLRDLNLEGTLKIAHLKTGETSIRQGQLIASAKAGQLKLQPTLTLYEGLITGDILLNVQGEKPYLQIKQTVQRLQIAPVLQALTVTNPVTGVLNMTAQLTTTLDSEKQQLQVAPLQITADLSKSNLVTGQQSMRLEVPSLRINLTDTSLNMQNLSLQALGVEVQAQLQAQLAKETFSGELKLSPFNLQTLSTRLGQPLPRLTDPKVLTTVALTTQFEGQSTQIALKKLNIRVDDTQLQGQFNFQKPLTMDFDLAVDTIDLDRYLPAGSGKESKPSTDKPIFSVAILEFLRSLSLNGILKIAQLKIAQLTVSQTQFVVSSKEGKIKIFPRAHFYDGTYRGNLLLDVQNVPPRLSTDEHLEEVQLSKLCQDLLGDNLLNGTAQIAVKLGAELTTSAAFAKTLVGRVESRLSDGFIKGIDLVQSIRQVKAILQGKPIPADNLSKDKYFITLNNTFTVDKAVWQTNDLTIHLPLLHVEGKGKIFPDQQIDFALTTKVIGKKDSDLAELQEFALPIRVFGAMSKPTVQPNLKAWFLAQTTSKINEAKQKFIEKSQDKVDKNLLDLLDNLSVERLFN